MLINFHHSLSFDKDTHSLFCNWVNIASFGNLLPQVHWHIMARFETDSYFPEPMWGQKQRAAQLDLPSFEVPNNFEYFQPNLLSQCLVLPNHQVLAVKYKKYGEQFLALINTLRTNDFQEPEHK
jgi:hypothetical protein